MAVAWMIRNDGKAFDVVQHLYGFQEALSPEDVEETLAAGEWLYSHTGHAETKKVVLQLIYAWAKALGFSKENMVERILTRIKEKPYVFLSVDFVNKVADKIVEAEEADMLGCNAVVCDELNQEFLRARFGGLYNTNRSSAEMAFRISSMGFNWYNIIYTFVADNQRKLGIRSVTIVRDEEATGEVDHYYKTHDGRDYYKQYPVDEFLIEGGRPVVEKKHLYYSRDLENPVLSEIYKRLQKGKSLQSLGSVPMNEGRLRDKLMFLAERENEM